MSKEPKKSAVWYIAATHYLTAGFAIPLIIGIALAFTVQPFVTSEIAFRALSLVTIIVALWLGVMYSARYLKKAYIITDPAKVVKLSSLYFIVIRGGLTLAILGAGSASLGMDLGSPGMPMLYAYTALELLAACIVFYVASKKYVQTSLHAEPAATPAPVPPVT